MLDENAQPITLVFSRVELGEASLYYMPYSVQDDGPAGRHEAASKIPLSPRPE